MTKSKNITAEEYVVAKLLEKEEELQDAKARIHTLERDLDAFRRDYENIAKAFKIEKTVSGDEYKITVYRSPDNKWNTSTVALSKSLKETEFREEFKYLVRILHLELPKEDLEDLN